MKGDVKEFCFWKLPGGIREEGTKMHPNLCLVRDYFLKLP